MKLISVVSLGILALLTVRAEADSFSGDWSVAWNKDLSHLSIYAKDGITVPKPGTLGLFGLGLTLIVVSRRRKAA